ncbi:DNA-directed RNA polymerase I subunit RPA12 [Antennarius striatus]|uniref:DNA-directed RNA polymerase I subunit RPA12 n=1 Tax=Antennarius striatus TaxID=241820 RepID=UPI0035B0AEF8
METSCLRSPEEEAEPLGCPWTCRYFITGFRSWTFDRDKQMSSSGLNPHFCPECGNVLPLPGPQETVSCPRCSFSIPVAEFSGQEIHSSVVLNPAEGPSGALGEEDSELKGPVIDRRCSRCHQEGMVYHTRQMRSADEGQTVFFTCIHCRYQEKEDS